MFEVAPDTEKGGGMDELSLFFEHMMRDAFQCSRWGYYFVNADFHRNANNHEDEYPAIMICALFILAERKDKHEDLYRKCLQKLKTNHTLACADEVLQNLQNEGVVFSLLW